MKIEANPLQMEAYYAEPVSIHMVEVSEDFINKPIFGSFTGNISRKTIEGVRKATEGLNLNKGATEGSSKRATESSNKGAAESSNKRTTTGSYLAAVKGFDRKLGSQDAKTEPRFQEQRGGKHGRGI